MIARIQPFLAILSALIIVSAGVWLATRETSGPSTKADFKPPFRAHLDHGAYFTQPFGSPQDVTRACLKCHPEAASDLMKSSHWTWAADEIQRPGMSQPVKVGKKNLINNFCLGIAGNWPSCTKCHAGYGWSDASFDFSNPDQVDCLVCHERSGQYVKAASGLPDKNVNLMAAAKSVGYPKRENCGVCHYFGGGGLGVKHGDMDYSLDNPDSEMDVHMGRNRFLCIDCHRTEHHRIQGKSFAVSLNNAGGIGCTDCHVGTQHEDERIDRHREALACQTCHIPTFARKVPTKMEWDWSKAGDAGRPENPHEYLKIKGEFKYEQSVRPEYGWFDLTVERYLLGDPINPDGPTHLNRPNGSIRDPNAKIWPFKIHRAKQPYDTKYRYLFIPVTAGKGGYWSEFDWPKALRLSEEFTGLKFSGEYGFASTLMAWPLSHMVAPKERALGCNDCHGPEGRMDFKALGYTGDPMMVGGRKNR